MKDISTFQDLRKNDTKLFADLLRLYNNQIVSYEKYFSSPITLIQENEKLNRIVAAYQQSRTYNWGLKIRRLLKAINPIR